MVVTTETGFMSKRILKDKNGLEGPRASEASPTMLYVKNLEYPGTWPQVGYRDDCRLCRLPRSTASNLSGLVGRVNKGGSKVFASGGLGEPSFFLTKIRSSI